VEPSCLEIAWKKAGSDSTAWFNAHAQVYENIYPKTVQVNGYLDADTPKLMSGFRVEGVGSTHVFRV
jgi:hypothetical protein